MEIGSVQANQPAPAAIQPLPVEARARNQQLIQAVKALNATELFGQNNELTFSFDRQTRQPLVRIVNRNTHEVIRQIPPEYAVRMAQDFVRFDQPPDTF